jgi:hypothetical protein
MSSRWSLSGSTPVDANGTPYALGTLTFYITGTTTPTDAYSNAGLTSALANPYTLGADGLIPEVFLTQVRYKILLKNAAGTTINTFDPVDKSIERISSSSAPSPAYPGLQYHNTGDGHLYERDSTNASWIDRGTIDSLLNAATVADQLTGTSTSLASTPDSVAALWEAGTATISANNISLPAGGGGVFSCSTATTTLTTISSATEGREIEIIFSNSQTITHGSGINTIGQLTQTVPAGARVRFRRNSSTWTIIWQNFATSPGRMGYLTTQYFSASGTYTRSKGCTHARVRTVGPGGSGASSDTGTASNGSGGGGGGAGAYIEEWVAPGTTETVTIGTGGAAVTAAGTNGNAGSGASSFGSFHSAAAGAGGSALSNGSSSGTGAGGAGGAATGGSTASVDGQAGGYSYRAAAGIGVTISGAGGSNPLGMGGAPVVGNAAAVAGKSGTGFGSGGSGGAVNGNNGDGDGGAGKDGICIVEEFGMS